MPPPCANDRHSFAMKIHSCDPSLALTIEMALNGPFSVERAVLAKALCISIATLQRSFAHGDASSGFEN